jgi:hypothetical protein
MNPMDVAARVALEFHAQQLRMITERLTYVHALLPQQSREWRGPAQQLFDWGVSELHRDFARAQSLIEAAEQCSMAAASQLSIDVG